jgi:cell wall-associated NlpC family hydrolase
LVVQGENDRVNAPARHAQFIAQHIPYAELWLPPDTRHNVHHERLFEWIQRVEDFLERRGDPANEALHRLQRERFPDERETIFQVHVHQPEGDDGQITLAGRVLTSDQRQVALDALSVIEFPGAQQPLAEQIRVLLDESTPWALVNRNVSDLRREPRNLAERVSQALIGQAVRILEERGEWTWVRMELDGYMGWMHASALLRCSQADVVAYHSSCQTLVQAGLLDASLLPDSAGKTLTGKLPFGARLPVEALEGDLAQVRLPDGRLWWVERSGLLPIDQAPRPDAIGIAQMLGLIQRFIGVPYLWGGSSPFGYDCSGLSQIFYGFMDLDLPRDADQQYCLGKPVEGDPQPGDLIFFGEATDARYKTRRASITHVAISLGGDDVIHATGAVWSVTYNSLNPQSPIYRERLHQNLIGVRRYV